MAEQGFYTAKTKEKKATTLTKPTTAEGKKLALDNAIREIQKQFGKDSIQKLSSKGEIPKVPVISSGAPSLDFILGVGGFPKGRIIEIYGPEASGKSTLALHVVKEAQMTGGTAAYIDMEHAMDLRYARRIGVNVDELIFSQPDYGEMALQEAEILTSSGAVDIIIIDSVAALTPKAEIDGDMLDQQMGLQARMVGKGMRKLSSVVSKTQTILIFINQVRQKIGVMFGNPETVPGGNALKFYSSIRLDIRRKENIELNNVIVGSRNRIKVIKNKLASPFRETILDIVFGFGIDSKKDLADLAISFNIIQRGGAWYTFGDTRFQGINSLMDALYKDDIFFETVKSLVETYLEKNRSNISNPFSPDTNIATSTELTESLSEDSEEVFDEGELGEEAEAIL